MNLDLAIVKKGLCDTPTALTIPYPY